MQVFAICIFFTEKLREQFSGIAPVHRLGLADRRAFARARRLFMPEAKKTSSARSLALPLQIEPACAGLRFGFGGRHLDWRIFFGRQTQVGASVMRLVPTFYSSPIVRSLYRSYCPRYFGVLCAEKHDF